MVSLDEIIGDLVFVSFRDIEKFSEIGIEEPSGHFFLKGYDQLGIWLEHPGILILRNEDENGRPLPADKRTEENIEAEFLATWDNINTIMHYPEREGFDFPSEFKKDIGFRFNKDAKTTNR